MGMNVADELGRARVMFKNRIILLLEKGVEPHTNISGIVYERFTRQSMDNAFIRIARELTNWELVKVGFPPKEKATLEIVDKWINKRVVYADTGWVRRFCCFVFKGEVMLKRCHASLEIINRPDNADRFHSLHWSDDPYTYQAFAEPKDIEAGAMVRLDVIFTTEDGGEAISQAASGPPMQSEIADRATSSEGAWIATPISLTWPMVKNQNYLPPGEYQAKLTIVSEAGNPLVKDLTIKSPRKGENLEIETMDTKPIGKMTEPEIKIVEIYEDNVGECGLIFSNSGSTNLNCNAKLLDVGYETPQGSLSLNRYSRVEDLVCSQTVAGFGKGKIPLFRWGKGMVDKRLQIVYQKGTESIGYGVVNVPILVLVNLWVGGTQNTYAICKLEDRVGWGYQLSMLKTGLQQDNPNLTTFQKS